MNIHFFKKRGQKLISCNFIIPVGMSNTWKENGSFAHLVEHLIFRGHPELTQYGFMRKIEGLGGIMNAFTDDKHTEIFVRIEERYLVEVVELIHEALIEFDVSEEDIKEELEIIEIEEAQVYTEGLLLNKILKLGDRKQTGNFSLEELGTIYKTYYRIENWTMLIVGEVMESTRKQLNKFATHNENKMIAPKKVSIPDFPQYSKIEIESQKYFAYYHPCRVLCDKVYMKIVKYLLTSGLSSYFYKTLIAENGYTYHITFQDVYYDKTAFVIFFSCEDDVFEELQEIFEKVFGSMDFIESLTDEEIRRAMNLTITEYCLKSESLSSLVQDLIGVMLEDRHFIDYDEVVDMLMKQSECEIRGKIKKLLFAKE